MTDVLVLTAVDLEARDLARELELPRVSRVPFPTYDRSGSRVHLRMAPVGLRACLLPGRWGALVADLVSPLVISAGTCGALAPGLEVGDLVLPESVVGFAGERLSVTLAAHAGALKLAPKAKTGLLLTTSEVVTSPEAKAERWRATGASVVDMESSTILAWASRERCSSLVVRAVSDTADQSLSPALVGLVSAEGRLRAGRALGLALAHPAMIPQALVLRRGTRQALKSVARLIATLVG